jgi:hypothetical protein
MKKLLLILPLVFLLCLALGCQRKATYVERFMEDGVEVVLNHIEPHKIGRNNVLVLEETLKIDTEDDEIANLGVPEIFGFDVNSIGEIYILRNYQGEGDFVFKFDANGKFIKSFGPQGQGPGESRNPNYIAIDHEDNILIFDYRPRILHKYDQNGVLIGDYKMLGGEARITSGPNENLLALVHSSEQEKDRTINTFILQLINPDLEVLHVIDEFSNWWGPNNPAILQPIFCWSASSENIYVVNEDRGYEILVFDFNGRLIRKIQKEFKQLPISENFKKKILNRFSEDWRESMSKSFPEFHPPIQNLVVGDDGLLLVATFEEGENPGEFLFDIFNEEGIFIGRKSLNIWIWQVHLWAKIKDNRFYCLKEKDSGFREVVVYKMIWQ